MTIESNRPFPNCVGYPLHMQVQFHVTILILSLVTAIYQLGPIIMQFETLLLFFFELFYGNILFYFILYYHTICVN